MINMILSATLGRGQLVSTTISILPGQFKDEMEMKSPSCMTYSKYPDRYLGMYRWLMLGMKGSFLQTR